MRAARPLMAALLILVCGSAFGSDFKVRAPATWKKSDFKFDGDLYVHQRPGVRQGHGPFVVLRSFMLAEMDAPGSTVVTANPSTAQSTAEFLKGNLPEVSRLRAEFLETVGVTGYSILAHEVQPTSIRGFQTVNIVQSRFTGHDGVEMQVLERQFIFDGKLFVVTYIEKSAAINDRRRVDVVMDFFQPQIPSRSPASELVGSEPSAGGRTSCPTCGADGKNSAEKRSQLKFRPGPEEYEICKDVPKEKWRKSDSEEIADLMDLRISVSCARGFGRGLWDIVKGLWNLAKTVGKLGVDSRYRDQVKASVGVLASEINRDSAGLLMRIVSAVSDAGSEHLKKVEACYSVKERLATICNIGSYLIGTGVLGKLVGKAALTKWERLKLERAIAKAVDSGQTVAKAKPVATAAKASTVLRKIREAPQKATELIKKNIHRGVRDDVVIRRHDLSAYVNSKKARETIEIMWFRESLVVPGSGHMAVRVGSRIYENEIGGLRSHKFVKLMSKRLKKGHHPFGFAFKASPQEQARIIRFFEKNKNNKNMSYNFLLQNCSETTLMAIRDAGVVRLPKAAALDPAVAFKLAKRLPRDGYRAVYSDAGKVVSEIAPGNIAFRAVGVSTAVGTSYGAYKGAQKVEDKMEEITSKVLPGQEPSLTPTQAAIYLNNILVHESEE